MHHRRAVALALVAVVLGIAGACSEPDASPPTLDTVGAIPEPTDITTIVPIVEGTELPDLGTAPPGSLFGGDLCTALVARDFTRVTFGGEGSGQLTDQFPASVDSCQYVVEAGDEIFDVVVAARTGGDMDATQPTDVIVEELADIGDAAVGIDRGDRYEVIVAVDNGWFAVIGPDQTSAEFLALQAAARAESG
jgi:hypothetical protein